MIHRAIPSTGETVPAVGIGTSNYRVDPSASERAPYKATLRVFAELGGKVLDTAPSHGNSESVVGDLMAELDILGRVMEREDLDFIQINYSLGARTVAGHESASANGGVRRRAA